LRLSSVDRHADGREDVEVVSLSWQEGLTVILNWRELHTGRVDRLALRPGISLLRRALGVVSRIRQSQDDRPLVDTRHRFNHLLRECAADSADTDDCCRFDALDR